MDNEHGRLSKKIRESCKAVERAENTCILKFWLQIATQLCSPKVELAEAHAHETSIGGLDEKFRFKVKNIRQRKTSY